MGWAVVSWSVCARLRLSLGLGKLAAGVMGWLASWREWGKKAGQAGQDNPGTSIRCLRPSWTWDATGTYFRGFFTLDTYDRLRCVLVLPLLTVVRVGLVVFNWASRVITDGIGGNMTLTDESWRASGALARVPYVRRNGYLSLASAAKRSEATYIHARCHRTHRIRPSQKVMVAVMSCPEGQVQSSPVRAQTRTPIPADQ